MGTTMKKVDIDTVYLTKIFTKSGLSAIDFCAKFGKSGSYYNKMIAKGYAYECVVDLICTIYKADKSKLVKEEPQLTPTAEEKPSVPQDVAALAKKVEGLEALVGIILDKLSQRTEAEKVTDADINANEKAVLLLKRMMFAGACEVDDFKSKAKSYNIPEESVEYAIKYAKDTLKYTTTKKGYGNNQKEWIMK